MIEGLSFQKPQDLVSLHFPALAPSASLLEPSVALSSRVNSGSYFVWTRLLALFKLEIYPTGRRHASLCDALLPTSQQFLKSPTPSNNNQFKPIAMVSSKGKPTDPKLREEAKEGILLPP